ncbi:hypothetical protein AB0I60_26900 [Actinosynnema sp. NPDC050436]|uniref:hypothetical protein n=1 Tax=Actinosynnema sp. NPDC050436 TaxID=3155659 RepID=UPI0033CCFBB1
MELDLPGLGGLIVLAGAGLAIKELRSMSDERHDVDVVLLGVVVLVFMALAPASATRARLTLDNAVAVECTVLALSPFIAPAGDPPTPSTQHDLECAGGYPTTYFKPSPQAEVGGRFTLLVDPTRAFRPTTASHLEDEWWWGRLMTAVAASLYMMWSGWLGARRLITTSSRPPDSPTPA